MNQIKPMKDNLNQSEMNSLALFHQSSINQLISGTTELINRNWIEIGWFINWWLIDE